MGNRVIFAAAGAGKTETIINTALAAPDRRILITTYTNRNAEEIADRISKRSGVVPPNIQIETWFSFLLRHAIKPYQSALTEAFRARAINFDAERPRYISKSDVERYYFDAAGNLYRDAAADFACRINDEAGGKVARRLEQIFDLILIDEIQDLAGYDLDFVEMMLRTTISVTMVGDPRQSTYSTNDSPKNKQYRGFGLYGWVEQRRKKGMLGVEYLAWSHRCHTSICKFADALFPDQPTTESLNDVVASHCGVFLVCEADLSEYMVAFNPVVLRWNRRVRVAAEHQDGVLNIGEVKGCTFDRVLVYTTKPMMDYLRTADPSRAGQRERLYVAATRPRFSLAFVVKDRGLTSAVAEYWVPNGTTS